MEISKNFDILKACRFCPMCRHVCSSGNISNIESDFPRGRAMILHGIYKGSSKYDKDLVDALYNCFLCGCCWDSCESHYDLPKLIKSSRIDMVAMGMAPQEAKDIKKSMVDYGNPYEVKDAKAFDVKNKYKDSAKTLYYMGFDINYFDHEIAKAALKVFEHSAIDYTLMKNELDCGKVFSLLGFIKESKAAAQELYDAIKKIGCTQIIVSDPLAYDCLKNDFKEFGLDLSPDIKVMHFSEFAAENLDKMSLKKQKEPVSLVDSEYLGKFNHILEPPRKVIKNIAGDGFIELMDNIEMQLASGEAAFIFRNKKFNAGSILAQKICAMAKERGLRNLVTLSPTTKNYINKSTDCSAIDIAEYTAKGI